MLADRFGLCFLGLHECRMLLRRLGQLFRFHVGVSIAKLKLLLCLMLLHLVVAWKSLRVPLLRVMQPPHFISWVSSALMKCSLMDQSAV
jgi:hypothetical protein